MNIVKIVFAWIVVKKMAFVILPYAKLVSWDWKLLNLIITLQTGTVLLKKVKKRKVLLQTFGKPQIAPRDLILKEQWFWLASKSHTCLRKAYSSNLFEGQGYIWSWKDCFQNKQSTRYIWYLRLRFVPRW